MAGIFAGWTAENYARFRRDLPDAAVDQIVGHFGLDQESRVVDLGAGTGQASVPIARYVRSCVAIEPEPDLLWHLRQRPDCPANLLTVLGDDGDLPLLHRVIGDGLDLVIVANALHFIDVVELLSNVRTLVRPGGGIAIVSHGLPLWLADTPWARAVNGFLADRFHTRSGNYCGLDEDSREERARLLTAAGFADVTVLRHHYQAELTVDYVIGHLYSALSEGQVSPDGRADFEDGIRRAIADSGAGLLTEQVPVVTLAARIHN